MVNDSLTQASGYFHSVPLDIFILVGLLVASTFLTFQFGKKTVLALLLALYPALIITGALPFSIAAGASSAQTTQINAGIFVAMWIAVFFLTRPFFVSSYPSRKMTQFIEAVSLGVLLSGALIASAYHLKLFPTLYAFSPPSDQVFSSELAFFAWLAAPFIGILLFVRS